MIELYETMGCSPGESDGLKRQKGQEGRGGGGEAGGACTAWGRNGKAGVAGGDWPARETSKIQEKKKFKNVEHVCIADCAR